MPTSEEPARRRPSRLEIRPRRRRGRRRARRLVRLALAAGFALLLVLLMIEPEPTRQRRVPPAPAPVELAIAAVPAPVARPSPPVEPADPLAEPAAPLPPAPPPGAVAERPPAPPAGTPPPALVSEDGRARLAGSLPPARGGAPEAAPALPIRPLPSPPLELVRPVPVAFPAPLLRRPAGRAPALALVLDDLGPSGPATRRAIRLPGPLTLAFLPYGESTAELAREARAAGHEVFLHLAMEPLGGEDPGPMALLSTLGAEELRRRLHWALGRVPGAVGVNNHMGSRLTADPRAMAIVMAELGRLGLPFVDSMTTGASVAGRIALEGGVPATARDVFLDNDPTPAAILAQLERAERLARRTGSALAIGHPYPSTLQVLADWLPRALGRGLRLVPATRMIELRGCAGELATRGGCLLRAAAEADAGERLQGCAGGSVCAAPAP